MKALLIQLRDALATADRVNVDREGVDGPDGHDANGKSADHILTPEFRAEWREIRAALAAVEQVLDSIEVDEQIDELCQYRDDEPDNARNLGLLNPMSAPRRVGL